MSESKSLLDWALFALSRGWAVFPCKPRSKEPNPALAPHGVQNFSKDEAVVRAWFEKEPNTNPAIALGPSSLTVMDVDEGLADKEAALAWFKQVFGNLETFVVQTGRRTSFGLQLYFSGINNNRPYTFGSVKGEIRSAGYYVLAPGARHDKSGEPYLILNPKKPVPAPPIILELTKEKAPRPQGAETKKVEPSWRHYFLVERARELYFAGLYGKGLEGALRWLYENRCMHDPVKDQRIATNEVTDICEWIGAHPPEYPLEPNDFIKLRYAAKDDRFKEAFDGNLLHFTGNREIALDYMIEVLAKTCNCKFEQIERIIGASTLATEKMRQALPDYSGIDF